MQVNCARFEEILDTVLLLPIQGGPERIQQL